jgi:hypothetical protein
MYNNLKNAIAASAVVVGLLLPAAADAAVFEGTFSVNANNGDGLIINTTPNVQAGFGSGNSFSFELTSVGQSVSFGLFDIWTTEDALNFDDLIGRAIETAFNFTAPPPPFGGDVDGSTVAGTIGFASWGSVDWDGATIVSFGALGDGQLQISLSDETFNGALGLNFAPGRDNGATVGVNFKLLANATEVPEPITIGLLGMGLVGLGVAARRRR